MKPSTPAWDDTPTTTLVDLDAQRTRRRWIASSTAAIATVAAVAMVVVSLGGRDAHVTTHVPAAGSPGVGTPIAWKTPQVSLSADDFEIIADGKTFTAQNTHVDLHSDPGGPSYWTLEAGWTEHGVQMLMNIYFASDGHNWWASEIRTYNGKANGDWIFYEHGNWFLSPLGTAYTGDLDLHDAASNSSLQIHGMHLTTNPRRFDCSNATGTYLIVPSYTQLFDGPPGSTGMANEVTVLDAKTCATPADSSNLALTWSSSNPNIITVTPSSCTQLVDRAGCERGDFIDVKGMRTGKATIHVVIKNTTNGAVVGQQDFAAHVGGGGGPATVPVAQP